MSGRSRNFENGEVTILVDLVEKYRQAIECKASGVVTNKQKAAAWEDLAKVFNSRSGTVPRTAKHLKEKWANIKKTAVRNHAADKKYQTGTGGGPSQPTSETTGDHVVNNILGDRLDGTPSLCDSDQDKVVTMDIDNVILQQPNIVSTDKDFVQCVLVESGATTSTPDHLDLVEPSTSKADWSDYSPSMLKAIPAKPLLPSLKYKTKVPGSLTNSKWCNLADRKLHLTKVKEEMLMEERQQKTNYTFC